MEMTLKEIATLLDGTIAGKEDVSITNIRRIEDAEKGSITFLSNPKYEQYLYTTRASAIIISRDLVPKKPVHASLLKVDDPYLSFTVLLEAYQKVSSLRKTGIESPVHIGQGSQYGENIYLGAFAYIGDHVTIGKNVTIYPQVHIGDHVTIGDNCILFPGVRIYERTVIGSYCTIQAGAVLGSHGFGFAPQPDGSYRNIPQVGNVVLEDHVDIGANTTIDCATFESTRIGKGVKIDNLVQIAHNVEIGENTVIASQVGISGSAKLGNQVVMGGQVGVAGHIQVASGTQVGGQTGITRTISDQGRVLFGTPAVDKHHFMKSYAIYKKLPEVMERIRQLEQKILNLPPSGRVS